MDTVWEKVVSLQPEYTDDGINIHVRNRGLVCDGKNADGTPYYYFKAAPSLRHPRTAAMHG